MNSTLWCKWSSWCARHSCFEEHCELRHAEMFDRDRETDEWLSFEKSTVLFNRKVYSAWGNLVCNLRKSFRDNGLLRYWWWSSCCCVVEVTNTSNRKVSAKAWTQLNETKPFPSRFGENCKTRNTLSCALEPPEVVSRWWLMVVVKGGSGGRGREERVTGGGGDVNGLNVDSDNVA